MSKLLNSIKKDMAELKSAVEKGANPEKVRSGFRDVVDKSGRIKSRMADPEVEMGGNDSLETIHKSFGYQSDSNDNRIVSRAEFQKASDSIWFFNEIMKNHNHAYDIRHAAKSNQIVRGMFNKMYDAAQGCGVGNEMKKAMGSTVAGSGDEWVPTQTSGQLFTELRLQTRLLDVFPRIDMATEPQTVPIKTSGLAAYRTGEAIDNEAAKHRASTVVTSSINLSSKKLAARAPWSGEMSEDSIIPILPMLMDDVRLAMSEAFESAIINGDTAATHIDNGTVSNYYGGDAPETCFLGTRAWADDESNETAASASIVISDLENMRRSMGKYGLEPSNLVWLVSPMAYFIMLTMAEVKTVDKYGQGATILNGELGSFYGIPIIVSGQMPENLSATGVYDGSTTDNTVIQLVRRDFGVWSTRREVTIKTKEDIETDQNILVATYRPAFVVRWPSGQNPIWTLLDVD